MLPAYVHALNFLLCLVALIGCLGRYDYNIVLGLGWIYIAHISPSLTASLSFYVMVGGSILIDLATIISESDERDKFTFVFMPLLEMILKGAMIVFGAYHEHKRKLAEQERSNEQQNIHNQG